MPVTLAPGRLRLATKPNLTGSLPIAMTIGMVAVAAFAASGVWTPPAATRTREQALTRTGRRRKMAVTRGQVPGKRLGRYIWHTFWAFCGHRAQLRWRARLSSRARPGGRRRTKAVVT